MTVTRYFLSTENTGLRPGSLVNELWEKDCIRDGDWYVPSIGANLPVNPERRRKWAANFALMKERGVSVPLTVDHLDSGKAESKRGATVDMFNEGDQLRFKAKPADAESATLMARCPEVSVEIERNFRDGFGNLYDEAITAITLTPKPVVPGQEGWKRIAASRDSGTTKPESEILLANPLHTHVQSLETSGDSTMFKPEQLAKLKTALSLKADAADTDIATAILAKIEAKPDTTELDTTKANLSRVQGELASAATRIASLEAGKAVEVDADALESKAENVTIKLSRLVESFKLTPAALKIAQTKLLGDANARPKLCLSRKAAVHAGLQEAIADTVLEILEANDSAELAKLQGEKSKAQVITLSRQTPGTTDDGSFTKAVIEIANGGTVSTGFAL